MEPQNESELTLDMLLAWEPHLATLLRVAAFVPHSHYDFIKSWLDMLVGWNRKELSSSDMALLARASVPARFTFRSLAEFDWEKVPNDLQRLANNRDKLLRTETAYSIACSALASALK